jgi:hypothetical protein
VGIFQAVAMDSGTLLTTVGRAGGLFARSWPRLFAWYLGAQLAHLGLMWLAVRAGYHVKAVGIALLAAVVLVSLLMYVGMFLLLRSELRHHRRAVEAGLLTPKGRPGTTDLPFLDAVSAALLTFLAFYTAWKFLRADALEFEYKLFEYRSLDRDAATLLTGGQVTPQTTGLTSVSSLALIGLGVGAYLLRLLLKKRGEAKPRGPLRLLAVTYLESLWIFITAYQAFSFLPSPDEWVKQRRAVAWLDQSYSWLIDNTLGLGPLRELWDAVAGAVGNAVGELWGAAVLPLMFITVVAVIYGRALERPDGPQPAWKQRLDPLTRRWQASPQLVRATGNTLVGDWRERWQPVADAFRLVIHSGLRPLLGYFLAFAAVTAAAEWLGIALREYVVGPQPIALWKMLDEPYTMAVDGLKLSLQVCLLAAAYDRIVGGLAGFVSSRDAPPATDAGTAGTRAAGSAS